VYQIPQCTAEQVLDSVEAVVLAGAPVDQTYVADYSENTLQATANALTVSVDLGLLLTPSANQYTPTRVVAHFFAAATEATRIDLLRMFIESYPPYGFFKRRLLLNVEPRAAAHETKIRYAVPNHEEEVKETLTSLGHYCGSLTYEPRQGIRVVRMEGEEEYLESFNLASRVGATADEWIRLRLGDEAYRFIQDENDEIITNLRDAVSRSEVPNTAKEVIQSIGNAIENFQAKLAKTRTPPVALTGTGIISKANELRRATLVMTKQRSFFEYLGHYRNAALHGIDPDIGSEWDIHDESAKIVLLVALSAMKSLVALVNGRHEL
jgi:hypothetical protein